MKKRVGKFAIVVLSAYCLCMILLSWIAGDQFRYRNEVSSSLSPAAVVGDMTAGFTLSQRFHVANDQINSIALRFADFGRANTGSLVLTLQNAAGQQVSEETIDVSKVRDAQFFTIQLVGPVQGNGWYTLTLSSMDGTPDNCVSVYYGNAMQAGRGSVAQAIAPDQRLLVNGVPVNGMLCMEIGTTSDLQYMDYYWPVIGILGVLMLLYFLTLYRRAALEKQSFVTNAITAFAKYRFLIKQLVARDFKTKYKRSVLGVFWSFLNPLLTMLVQYIIFSTLFQSDIPNFPAYLLTGIVMFNFFNESTSLGLTAITGNAALITKVYVPKIVYPLTRVLSSMVNFLLSLLPLFVVLLCTGERLTKAVLLLPFIIVCLLTFCIGVSLLLSTLMVFFRDMQFLWSVLTMIWMYATPIFYPETIIPQQFLMLYKMNPLYHIIRFTRITLIDGVSPEPKAYLLCIIMAVVPFLTGLFVFRKRQNQFALNL